MTGARPDAHADARVIRVACVDDNTDVSAALRARISSDPGLLWVGQRDRADALLQFALETNADVLILDMDMPGRNVLEALRELSERAPNLRPIVFSGHCRRDVIEQSLECGAWGFVAKHDGEAPLLRAIYCVAAGEVTLSREATDVLASPS
ncbi:MAG TPA: response regulator transcription factor [Phycisphaerales bacterium]|nr:response regulator transcription factor [Phycisphaerales bacterium]